MFYLGLTRVFDWVRLDQSFLYFFLNLDRSRHHVGRVLLSVYQTQNKTNHSGNLNISNTEQDIYLFSFVVLSHPIMSNLPKHY